MSSAVVSILPRMLYDAIVRVGCFIFREVFSVVGSLLSVVVVSSHVSVELRSCLIVCKCRFDSWLSRSGFPTVFSSSFMISFSRVLVVSGCLVACVS